MIVLTGPRSTLAQEAALLELSTMTELPLLHLSEPDLLDATECVAAPGWEYCTLATADIEIARSYRMKITEIEAA
jgi:hypothetical protein